MLGVMTILGFCVLFPILVVAYGLWGGFILSKLWFWFVVPIFGIKALTLFQAWGLTLPIIYLKSKETATKDGLLNSLLYPFAHGVILLVIGYILKGYI